MSNRLLKKVVENISACPEDELKNLVSAAIEEEDILYSLFDNLEDGHLIINDKSIVVFANAKARSSIPYKRSAKSIEGLRIEECLTDKDILKYVSSVLKGEEKGEEKDFSIQSGNEVRVYRVSFRRIAAGNKSFMDVMIKEITDSIRKETRLRRSESLASMTTMAAGVAHEIKNPLAAMALHTQLLRKAFTRFGSLKLEDAEKYLSVLDEEIEHLNKIAVDFLFAVKPMEVELKKDNINLIITDILSFLEPEAEEKKVEVVSNLSSFIPNIEIDARLVKQALLNLIQNAFAAMEGGGKLTVSTKLNGNFISVKIEDTGIGIDEDKLQKIFEPYYTTKASGTGLGLTLVYKIMKEHHGDIHVSSRKGEGTSFVLDFPIPASERMAIGEDKE